VIEAARAKRGPSTAIGPASSTGPMPSGYNTSRTNTVVIGSNPNDGSATNTTDKAKLDKIRADTEALKKRSQRPQP